VFPHISSADEETFWPYSWMWCPSLNPLVKLPALHKSVVPVGVTVLLGVCNPPLRGHGEPAKPGLMYPLCGFLAVIQLISYRGCKVE
jgi:hypothetical protein